MVICEDDAIRIRDRGTNPALVVEVLSPSSARRHRVGKFTQYRRDNDDWVYRQASGHDASCHLEQLAVDIPLASLYSKITFPEL